MEVNAPVIARNCSNSTSEDDVDIEIKILTDAVLGLVCLFIVVGNVIIISAIVVGKSKSNDEVRQTTFIFIQSLCVADIIVAVCGIPFKLYIFMSSWDMSNETVCLIGLSVDMMACTSSIFHLLMMSLDRYLAICRPLVHRTLPRYVVYVAVGISWVVPCLISFPAIMTKLHLEERKTPCIENLCRVSEFNGTFQVLACLLSFYVPTFIICVFYYKIYTTIKHRTLCNKEVVHRSETAAAKTIGVILACYLICWFPFFSIQVLAVWISGIPAALIMTVEMLGYLNSMLNPPLYYNFSKSVKLAVKHLLNDVLCRCTIPNQRADR